METTIIQLIINCNETTNQILMEYQPSRLAAVTRYHVTFISDIVNCERACESAIIVECSTERYVCIWPGDKILSNSLYINLVYCLNSQSSLSDRIEIYSCQFHRQKLNRREILHKACQILSFIIYVYSIHVPMFENNLQNIYFLLKSTVIVSS